MQLSVDDLLQVIQNFRIRNFLRTPFSVLPLRFPGRQSEIFRIRKIRTCQGAYSYTMTRFPCILSSRPEVVLHSLISGSKQAVDAAQSVLYLSSPEPKLCTDPLPAFSFTASLTDCGYAGTFRIRKIRSVICGHSLLFALRRSACAAL